MHAEIMERAGEIIRQNTAHNAAEGHEPYCVLALFDENGYPTVSTLTPAKADGIRWITFCTGLESNKAKRIRECSRAGLCFNTGGAYNITLVGTIEIVTDPATKREMWYAGMGQHFQNADDPAYCVLRFRTQRYNLLVDWKEAAGTL